MSNCKHTEVVYGPHMKKVDGKVYGAKGKWTCYECGMEFVPIAERDEARTECERERKHARQVVNEAIETCHDASVLEENARLEVEAWRRRAERIGSLLPYTILIEDTPWPDIKKALVSGDVDALDKLIGVKP